MARPELVGNVLHKSLDKLGLLPRAKRFQIFWAWNRIVGELARNARPRRIDGDVLYVATNSSAWAQELTIMRKSIISRINAYLGGDYIKDIRFSEHLWGTTQSYKQPDAGGQVDEEYKRFMAQEALAPDEERRIISLTGTLADSPLASVFQRFAVTMEKRKKYLIKKGFSQCDSCGFLYQPGRKCPYCKAKQELNDYNRVLAILERNPEMSDITLSVLTGVKQKEILAKARQTLDSSWYRRLRQAYFTVDSRKLSEDEQIRLQQLMVKLVSLRTGQPGYLITQEDLDKVLGKRLSGLVKGRTGRT